MTHNEEVSEQPTEKIRKLYEVIGVKEINIKNYNLLNDTDYVSLIKTSIENEFNKMKKEANLNFNFDIIFPDMNKLIDFSNSFSTLNNREQYLIKQKEKIIKPIKNPSNNIIIKNTNNTNININKKRKIINKKDQLYNIFNDINTLQISNETHDPTTWFTDINFSIENNNKLLLECKLKNNNLIHKFENICTINKNKNTVLIPIEFIEKYPIYLNILKNKYNINII